MLKRRIISFALVSVLFLSTLSGCGIGKSNSLSDEDSMEASDSAQTGSSSADQEKNDEEEVADGTFEIQMHTDGTVKLNYYSTKNISTVEYDIYSEIGGKDDNVTYSAEYDGRAWFVDLSDDVHKRSGNYHVEVYLNGSLIGDTSFNFPLKLNKTSIILQKNKLRNGDAKFYKGNILTCLGNSFVMLDLEGNEIRKYTDIKGNWFNILEDEDLIVFSNKKNETGIIQLDKEGDIITRSTIAVTENISIDPTIVKGNGIYYATSTEVIGTLNNDDLTAENGEYILRLYRSEDLVDWTYVTDIVDEFYNIEDVDMYALDNRLIAVFEKEQLDQGDSAIYLTISEDEGKTWSEPQELIPADADHEPATLERYGENFYLFYSSDAEVPGFSYDGASAYYSVYDSNFNCLVKDVKIQTETAEGILFYDFTKIDGSYYIAFETDYFDKKNLIIERVID